MNLEQLTGGHEKQLDALTALLYDNDERFQLWWCSRRAAKTTAVAIALAELATSRDGSNCIYVGITRKQVKNTIWRVIWKPLLERLGVDCKHNETDQQTIFPNGSSVVFGGIDDRKHIETHLGNRLDQFVCDEAQSAPSRLLRALFTDIISPALSDYATGKFLFSGTIPEVPAGYFYELITGKQADGTPTGRWLRKNWSRWDNPHLKDQEKALADHLRASGLTIDHPSVRRDWFGELTFDPEATAYRFDPARSSYHPERANWSIGVEIEPGNLLCCVPPRGVNAFSIGTDPGTRDRWAMVLWGWDDRKNDVVYQIAEWVTPKKAKKRNGQKTDWNDARNAADVFYAHYSVIVRFFRDAGSSTETLELFSRYVGRMVIASADKMNLGERIERQASLMATGRCKVIAGSQLEADLKIAKWDQDARAEGKYQWDNRIIHPDVGDAGNYGLEGFIPADLPVLLTGMSEERRLAYEEEKAWRERDWAADARRAEEARGEDVDAAFRH